MGQQNYLIDGVSGAGKTAVATELEKLGYQAIHGDRELKYRGDPKTGEPLNPPMDPPTSKWLSEHLLWDLQKVNAYISNRAVEVTFFCGGSRNSQKFIDQMDGVFILDVSKETMIKRIDERIAVDPTDFGASEEERQLILELHASQKDIPKSGIVIDANQPLDQVVREILSHVQS